MLRLIYHQPLCHKISKGELIKAINTEILNSMIAGVEWNDLGTIHEEYGVENVGSLQPQSPLAAAQK